MAMFGNDIFCGAFRRKSRMNNLESRVFGNELSHSAMCRRVGKLEVDVRDLKAPFLVGVEDSKGFEKRLARLESRMGHQPTEPLNNGSAFFEKAYAGEYHRDLEQRLKLLEDKLKVLAECETRNTESSDRCINNHSARINDALDRVVKLEKTAATQELHRVCHDGRLVNHSERLCRLESRDTAMVIEDLRNQLKALRSRFDIHGILTIPTFPPFPKLAVDKAVPNSDKTVTYCAPVVPCDQELFSRFYGYMKRFHPAVAVQKTASYYGLDLTTVRTAIKRFAEL